MSLDRLGIVTRLALTKNADFGEDAQLAFMDVLMDAPVELLRAACTRLARAQTYGMPTAADILAMCDTIRRDQVAAVKALPAAQSSEDDRRRWVHCQHCQDDPAAWLPIQWCNGNGPRLVVNSAHQVAGAPVSFCGEMKPHGPHSYTERCVCHMAAWRQERRMTRLSEDQRRRA